MGKVMRTFMWQSGPPCRCSGRIPLSPWWASPNAKWIVEVSFCPEVGQGFSVAHGQESFLCLGKSEVHLLVCLVGPGQRGLRGFALSQGRIHECCAVHLCTLHGKTFELEPSRAHESRRSSRLVAEESIAHL